jgi:SpoIID/LytB domain protein
MPARSRLRRGAFLAVAMLLAIAAPRGAAQVPRAVAYRLVDLTTGGVLASAGDATIDRVSLPGSTVKMAALVAALESHTISPNTRVACPGFAEIEGRRVACAHPRVRRPLTASEALSYSCHAYFATVGERLPRARLNGVLASLGLPAAPSGASMPLAATGLSASPVAPSALLRAFVQIVAGEPTGLALRGDTRAVVLEGLRGSAVFGTAAAFGAKGVEAFAETGTPDAAGNATDGIVLAAWPAARPTRAAVVVVAGAAGAAAAEHAAALATGQPLSSSAPARQAAPSAAKPGAAPASPASSLADPAALTLRVGHASSRGYDVRVLGLEDYVGRVLAGEAAPRSTPAALEALAITVRTFALANRARHRRDGFDLCDQTHCQVLREPYAAARAAAEATAGLVLAWQGAPASVYYTASCGGTGERPSNVWPGAIDPPFLPSKRDTGCANEPPWSSDVSARDLQRALAAGGFRGREIRALQVRSRSTSGRVLALGVPGLSPDEVSGQTLRMLVGRTLGWHLIKSTDFQVTRVSSGYRFTGRGFGHGVGLCVIGATRRAAAGASRASLLEQYFPGLQVAPLSAGLLNAPRPPVPDPAQPLASGEASGLSADLPTSRTIGAGSDATERPAPSPSPGTGGARPATGPATLAPATGIAVDLGAADERDRGYVAAIAERALAAAAARTGRVAPAGARLVFHPSVESFTRATGESQWSWASTRGARVDLQPYATLRDRGELESTVAHEAGHLVTGPALAGRSRWVHEGAAMFASGILGAQEIAAARRLGAPSACPPDSAFTRPASAADARTAREKARECFARALASGARWDEVR